MISKIEDKYNLDRLIHILTKTYLIRLFRLCLKNTCKLPTLQLSYNTYEPGGGWVGIVRSFNILKIH